MKTDGRGVHIVTPRYPFSMVLNRPFRGIISRLDGPSTIPLSHRKVEK